MADVAHERQARVEGVADRRARLGAELAEPQQAVAAAGEEALGDVARVGLEVAGRVRVVGDDRRRAREALARVLPGERAWRRALAPAPAVARREPPDREVGQQRRRRSRPRARGPRPSTGRPSAVHSAGSGAGSERAQEVARVVRGVAEQQHVARRRPAPGVEGEGQEARAPLRPEGRPCPKTWAISSKATARAVRPWAWRRSTSGSCGREEGARRDQQVVGLVLRVAQRRRGRRLDARREQARRRRPRGSGGRPRPGSARRARGSTPARKRAGSSVTSRIATGPAAPGTLAVPDSDHVPSNCPWRSVASCG